MEVKTTKILSTNKSGVSFIKAKNQAPPNGYPLQIRTSHIKLIFEKPHKTHRKRPLEQNCGKEGKEDEHSLGEHLGKKKLK